MLVPVFFQSFYCNCILYMTDRDLVLVPAIFQSVYSQAAQTHYMNADVTLAYERCCVTNDYLQRLVWDRSVFLKRDKKCYVFK